MATCAKCGSTISVQDVVAGKYRKVEGSSYCLACAPARTPAAATAATPAPAAPSRPSAHAKPAASSRTAAPASKSGPSSSSSSSRISRPGASKTASSVRRASARDNGDGDEDGGDERPRGYTKPQDPTLKWVGIIAAILMVAGGTFFIVTQRTVSAEKSAIAEAAAKSKDALDEIVAFVAANQNDEAIDATESFIKERQPLLNDRAASEVDRIKTELVSRRELAQKKRDYRANLAEIQAQVDNPARADEIKRKIERTEGLMSAIGSAISDAERKDFAALKVRNTVAVLESYKTKADGVREKSPEDWAAITLAYTQAEEMITDQGEQLIKSGVPGSARARELMVAIRDAANDAADRWAESETQGFAKAPARNLLDAKEFHKPAGATVAPWVPTPSADFKLENNALTVKGLARTMDPNAKALRAGKLQWAPDIKTPIRNYELTLRFKVVKKGFTLIARAGTGYMHHTYGFETATALAETKAANQAEKSAAAATPDKSVDLLNTPASQLDVRPGGSAAGETAFTVEEGKSYEVVEKVHGKRIQLLVKPLDGSEAPDPLQDTTNARYGGLAFQVLPGAEVVFEVVSIKILN